MDDPREPRVRAAEETILELHAENEQLRALLKKCADKLEQAAIQDGTDPEWAAIAVEEFRSLTGERT